MSLKFNKKKVKILVIGDLMLDCHLFASCERISPEAPVLIVVVNNEEHSLGGAGNVLRNLYSLGAEVNILSVVGDDETGHNILGLIQKCGISTSNIFIDKNRTSTKKTRVISSNQQMVRIDRETLSPIEGSIENKLIESFKKMIHGSDLVLISDYQKGVLTDYVLSSIIEVANQNKRKVIVDPKGSDFTKYKGVTIIKPNKYEAEIASGHKMDTDDDIKEVLKVIKSKTQAEQVIITLSEKGIAIYDVDLEIIPTRASEVYDVSGAGDTVLASLGFCLAHNNTLIDSCHFANNAAAIVISKIGTAVTTVEEVTNHMKMNVGIFHNKSD